MRANVRIIGGLTINLLLGAQSLATDVRLGQGLDLVVLEDLASKPLRWELWIHDAD
jgi:hypothetical protein